MLVDALTRAHARFCANITEIHEVIIRFALQLNRELASSA
jgi:hypothetical protein